MPASRTPKRTTRKDKGKAPATPRRSPPRSPSIHYPQLFNYTRPLKPTWLDKVLVALLNLYNSSRARPGQSIEIRGTLVDKVAKLSDISQQYSLAGGRKSWTTQTLNALASFRHHQLIEWLDHRQENESLELTQKLVDIFEALLKAVKAEQGFKLSSLRVSEYQALFMWFKDLCKKNKIKNLTKHEGYMNQMDAEKQRDKLQAEKTKLVESMARDTHPAQGSEDERYDDSADTGTQDKDLLPLTTQPTHRNAVAGPSRLPQTPRRSSTHNVEGVYPTPESRPRRTRSEEVHGAASTAEPRIHAPGLHAPTGSDSDNDEFHDASNGMDVDDPLPPPPNHLELAPESQVAGLTRENAKLLSQNAELQKEVDELKSQIAEMDRQIKEEKAAKEKVQKELEQTEGLLGKAQGTELYLRDKLEKSKSEADKLVDPKRLGLSLARYSALSERYDREITQLREELDGHKTAIAEYEAVQKQNEEAAAAFQARFKFVGVSRQ